MKEPNLSQVAEDIVEEKLKVLDIVIEELIEPLESVGSPERLLGKKYEDWTAQDLARLSSVYGTGSNNPLSNLIFNKTLERIEQLEEL